MMVILFTLFVLVGGFFALSIIALFQRKEYRADRLWVYVTEAFVWKDFFFRKPFWTAKTIVLFLLIIVGFTLIVMQRFIFTFVGVLLALVLAQVVVKLIVTRSASRKIRQHARLLVIGVTGSYGKTMTKEMIATVLSKKFNVLKTPQHVNTDYGIAQVILRDLRPEHEVFVVEMGAYKRGEIASICRMVCPRIGVLTGINEQHMALFGSIENTVKAKGELVGALPSDGILVFNQDDERVVEMVKRFTGKKVGFSGKKGNEETAIVIAKHFGLSDTEVKRGLDKLPKERIEKKKGLNGAAFLDDSYSSNPTGFLSALDVLAQHKGRKIVVTPGIIELGSARERVHRELGEKVNSIGALLIVTSPSFAKTFGIDRWCQSTNDDGILRFLKKNVASEDTVLIEGRISAYLMKGLLLCPDRTPRTGEKYA